MKNKIKLICTFFIFFITLYTFVYAEQSNYVYNGDYSICPSSTDYKLNDISPQNFCKNKGNNSSKSGMNSCAQQKLENDGIFGSVSTTLLEHYNEETGRYTVYYYDAARIDVWGNKSNDWETNTGLGIKTCPGMRLKYYTTTDLPYSITEHWDEIQNIKLESVSSINYNYIKSSELNTETQKFWQAYQVFGAKITENGINIDKKNFSYIVDISKLETIQDDKLGWNGLGTENDTRVFHYWLPYVAVFSFEYKYEDPKKDCDDEKFASENQKYCCNSQDYAYKNIGKCCSTYPETCCENTDEALENWDNIDSSVRYVCCNSEDSVQINDTTLYSFMYYYKLYSLQPWNRSKYETAMYQKCINMNICDYNDDDDTYPSCCDRKENSGNENCKDKCKWDANAAIQCCDYDEYKNDARCQKTCDDTTYFRNNLTTCCNDKKAIQNNPDVCCDTNIIGEDKYNEYCNFEFKDDEELNGYTCMKNEKWNLKKTTRSKYTRVIEEMQVIPIDYIKSIPSINSGRGFSYDLKIAHTLTINTIDFTEALPSIPLCKTVTNAQNSYNTYLETFTQELSQKLNNYINNGDTGFTLKLQNGISYNYNIIGNKEYYNYNFSKTRTESVSCMSGGSLTSQTINLYPKKIIITFDPYIYTLPKYYINQFNDLDATYSSDNINEFLEGGNKIYSNINDNGYYDFSISVNNAGVYESLSTTSNYTCTYKVNNCLYNGKCIDEDCTDSSCSTSITDGTPDYYYRTISLSMPFPNNRRLGANWNYSLKKQYIDKQEDGAESVYRTPLYSITLTPETVKNIKDYNKEQNNKGGYLDWNTLETTYNSNKRKSTFLTCLSDGNSCPSNDTISKIENITIPSNDIRLQKVGNF